MGRPAKRREVAGRIEEPISGDNAITKSIVLTKEAYQMAQRLQAHFADTSLSAIVRRLLLTCGPELLSGTATEAPYANMMSLMLHLQPRMHEMVMQLSGKMGMDPSTMIMQMILESTPAWIDKARGMSQRIDELQKQVKEKTPGDE